MGEGEGCTRRRRAEERERPGSARAAAMTKCEQDKQTSVHGACQCDHAAFAPSFEFYMS